MKVRFQADADLSQVVLLATLRREPAIDFQSADQASLRGLNDIAVLAKAAQDGRLLVTHDLKTMPWFFSEFITTNHSPGVIIVPQHLFIACAGGR